MNTPVKFEIAKLLREKGYNEKCKLLYKDGELINCKPYNVVDNKTFQSTRYYIAPTIAEVVMWLYEKHNIWISVDPENDKDTWFHTISYNKSETIFGNYNTYNSPTEAYEAAIEYTLNNLL